MQLAAALISLVGSLVLGCSSGSSSAQRKDAAVAATINDTPMSEHDAAVRGKAPAPPPCGPLGVSEAEALKVVGVVLRGTSTTALFENSKGMGSVVRVGDCVGPDGQGTVATIEREAVTVAYPTHSMVFAVDGSPPKRGPAIKAPAQTSPPTHRDGPKCAERLEAFKPSFGEVVDRTITKKAKITMSFSWVAGFDKSKAVQAIATESKAAALTVLRLEPGADRLKVELGCPNSK